MFSRDKLICLVNNIVRNKTIVDRNLGEKVILKDFIEISFGFSLINFRKKYFVNELSNCKLMVTIELK